VSLPRDLCVGTVEDVVAHCGLAEVAGGDGPFLTLSAAPGVPFEATGQMRVFRGDGVVQKVVYVGLSVEKIGLDSHMVFAFTDPASALPHFTLDSVQGQGFYAFHLDLIPRVELGTHLQYMDAVYGPLTDTFDQVRAWDGLSATNLTPRQYAVMSPWMLVSRATEEAFKGMDAPVGAYRDHWYSVVDKGVGDDVLATVADVDLPARDAALRANLFSPEVDPVWGQVAGLIGTDASEALRAQLLTNDI
jgi:hypothetical protein